MQHNHGDLRIAFIFKLWLIGLYTSRRERGSILLLQFLVLFVPRQRLHAKLLKICNQPQISRHTGGVNAARYSIFLKQSLGNDDAPTGETASFEIRNRRVDIS